MEPGEMEVRLAALEARVEELGKSSAKTRNYFLWLLIIAIATVVVPLLIFPLLLPSLALAGPPRYPTQSPYGSPGYYNNSTYYNGGTFYIGEDIGYTKGPTPEWTPPVWLSATASAEQYGEPQYPLVRGFLNAFERAWQVMFSWLP